MSIIQTAERHSSKIPSDNVMHQRHMIAYDEASKLIKGKVLEIGSGEGYGIEYLAPHAIQYHAIDKFVSNYQLNDSENSKVIFHKMKVPPLVNFENSIFDYVVSFQVIEHIEKDEFFLREVYRVLKPGGILILTTPNKKMSLTRNPWHIREYTPSEIQELFNKVFDSQDIKGVYGNQKVMDYYYANKLSISKITRFDLLDLQHKLPRKLLQIPYDILNRINRNKLHKANKESVNQIILSDFYIDNINDNCFDFFIKAQKKIG